MEPSKPVVAIESLDEKMDDDGDDNDLVSVPLLV